ncbi:MAG: PKD domain-containing protein [Bacteroidota bacterium]
MRRGLQNTFIIIFFIAGLVNSANAQSSSNKGKDFWLGYGNHVRDWATNAPPEKMSLYVTSDVNTNVTVEVKGVFLATKAVAANGITIFEIPDGAKLPNEGKYDNGIHVTSEKPVVVYSHIFASNISGATLVLPTNTLGKEYYSINYTQISNEQNSYSYFFVVAVEDNTEVEIIPSATTKGGWLAGSVNRVTLQKGQIYQVLGAITPGSGNASSGSDLTGSRIRSISTTLETCKRIAVFSGSGKISIGCAPGTPGSADNLYQQVYPTQAWGKKFITSPLKSRNYDVYRVVKSDPAANVTINGVAIPAASFTNQFFYDLSSQQVNVVESDKPIQVVQYAVSQGKGINCTNIAETTGDPEMIFLNPIEQNIENITLYSASEFAILSHFINVVMETAFVGSFKLDNAVPANAFQPVPGAPGYSYAQISVSPGVHNLSADRGFNAIAYGFGANESYGYSAGTNVKSLTIQARSKSTNLLVENLCINEAFNYSIRLKYKTDALSWNLGNGIVKEILNPVAVDNNPADGIYEYKFPDPITYTEAKDYFVTVTAKNPTADGCGNVEVIEVTFSAFNPPTASYSFGPIACEGSGILFTDKSDVVGSVIKKWFWDFGDGTTATEQNPTHIFVKAGEYKVTLIAYSDAGCESVSIQNIVVNKLPVAGFSSSLPNCDNKQIVFTDASTSAGGKIVKWVWNPGDGSAPLELNSNAPFSHQYATPGIYKVSLKVVSEYGCESSVLEKSLIINPTPVVDFVVPEVCINDQFAFFTTNSSISDGSALTYLWNFGDDLANVANPNTSAVKNASHRYTKAGDYQVTLTVRSKDGCESSLTQSFTVNGATPVASFVVGRPLELCSNKEVIFTNTSTVDFGTLSKVEWFFDYLNSPTIKIVDEDPLPGKEHRFQYPIFTSPGSKSITVRMLAYSGGTCADEEIQVITLLAAPKVSFTSLPNVCMEVPPYQFTQASEINGQNGAGRYYGKGVSLTGLFSPAVAGLGPHTIKYVFSALNGCADSLSQEITVMPTPKVNAGKDTLLLEGTWIQLKSVATGSNLTYKWFPSTGLSRDDIANPMASPPDDVVYTLTVTSDQGCTASDQAIIKVLKLPVAPNTFTPNGDGVNDLWQIKNLSNYPNPTIQVFNRYGDRVFGSFSAAEITWDGKNQGIDIPVGTYYYIIRPGSGRGAMSGSVTILR